jgi:adenine-specific DNA-methyltransferase
MQTAVAVPFTSGLSERADARRVVAARQTDRAARSSLGQFLTPAPIAEFMAGLFGAFTGSVRLLDAGAGVGALTAAFVGEACCRASRLNEIHTTAFEVDAALLMQLRDTLEDCAAACEKQAIRFEFEALNDDFIAAATARLDAGLFAPNARRFTHAILNPPYKKLESASEARYRLRSVGIETSNLYTAFLSLAVLLLEPGGELVAIIPRSFCNGPYFRPFRELFLREMSLRRLHVFESRTEAFSEDEVLQETVILHAVKGGRASKVIVSSSDGPDDDWIGVREVGLDEVVRPNDPEAFIHVVADANGDRIAGTVGALPATLSDLGMSVSTGRVVDFRAREHLRERPGTGVLPLIYPTHFEGAKIVWPKTGKKPNGLADVPGTSDLWMPSGTYVLVKRFSSKEEPRRVVAAVFEPEAAPGDRIGFENHLNVFHARGGGLDTSLALGLATYLNSTLIDEYFRQFNGHTQVNATDLRNLRFPARETLQSLGKRRGGAAPDQAAIDTLVEDVLGMAKKTNPMQGKRKVDGARAILKALGMPRAQQNDRSAYTLLALLGLKPTTPWSKATAPLLGITPIMDFIAQHHGKVYKPNTRESVRRFTIHQFVEAGLAVASPDEAGRPTNSGKNVYQIESRALEVLRTWGTRAWDEQLAAYLGERETLARRYVRAPGFGLRAPEFGLQSSGSRVRAPEFGLRDEPGSLEAEGFRNG